jgi:hypothetical protein
VSDPAQRGYMLPSEAPERYRAIVGRLVSEFGVERVRVGFERLAPAGVGIIHEVGVAADATWERGWSFNMREPERLDAFIAGVKAQIAGASP